MTGVPAAAARPPCSTTYTILAFVLLPGCRDGAAGRTLDDDFIVESVLIFISTFRTGRLPGLGDV